MRNGASVVGPHPGQQVLVVWWLTTNHGQSLPTDRLFTGQFVISSDDRFYFFKARYYDAMIGKFAQADTVVPDAKNPQALNRYAYALNNPLRFVDPTGHDSMDLNWKGQFTLVHGYGPSEQDWRDRQFSLSHPGSGPNGGWTDFDWQSYHYARATLGPALLAEIGRPQDVGAMGGNIADTTGGAYVKDVPWIDGPDGTRIYLGGEVPHGAAAWTFGNNIIIGKGTIDRLGRPVSLSWYRALSSTNTSTFLQFRRSDGRRSSLPMPPSEPECLKTGDWTTFGNGDNALEATAYSVQLDISSIRVDRALGVRVVRRRTRAVVRGRWPLAIGVVLLVAYLSSPVMGSTRQYRRSEQRSNGWRTKMASGSNPACGSASSGMAYATRSKWTLTLCASGHVALSR